jgi:hypothetical protein
MLLSWILLVSEISGSLCWLECCICGLESYAYWLDEYAGYAGNAGILS